MSETQQEAAITQQPAQVEDDDFLAGATACPLGDGSETCEACQ